jgi:hypothetical protein
VHLTVISLLTLAGIGFCLAAVWRWRSLAHPEVKRIATWQWALWLGFAFLTAATVLAVVADNQGAHRDLGYGCLAVWAGFASLLFLSRWLAMPSPSLLALPVGALALMIATAGATGPGRTPSVDGPLPWIVLVHAGFMTLHVGAMLVAGTAGILYLTAAWLLKRPSPRALRLPNLRLLERLVEVGSITATGLMVGGIATGGVAMRAHPISLSNPTAAMGLATMVVLLVILSLRRIRRLGNRGMAMAALVALACSVLSALSQVVFAHG